MKKFLVLLVAFLMVASVAMAADGYPNRLPNIQSAKITSGTCAHISTRPCKIVGVVVIAKQAAAYVGIIDSAGTGAYNSEKVFLEAKWGTVKDKLLLSEATQYSTNFTDFTNMPINCDEGAYVYMSYTVVQNSGSGADAVVFYTTE